MAEPPVTVPAAALQQLAAAIFQAVGTPPDLAAIVAASLVGANLAGHDSHGVQHVPHYVHLVRAGKVHPAVRPHVTQRQMATATVDGGWGWGQPAAHLATETAIDLAEEFGVGVVTIQHCHHIGRAGAYVEAMARVGMTGFALCNAGSAVVPYGGRDRRLGTNPFAWAAPTANPDSPLLLDYATSTVAIGKLDVALAKGEAVASGLLLDADGHPTTAPADFRAGGALRAFGSHKGYALSVMVEVLGGVLSGGGPSCLPDYRGGNGTLVLALKIPAFQSSESFLDQTSRFGDALRSSRPEDGFERVLLPGEPESQARRVRTDHGIPLPAQTHQQLQALAAEVGLQINDETFTMKDEGMR